jgi:hypothetical protein
LGRAGAGVSEELRRRRRRRRRERGGEKVKDGGKGENERAGEGGEEGKDGGKMREQGKEGKGVKRRTHGNG